jgi:hypothetical protein
MSIRLLARLAARSTMLARQVPVFLPLLVLTGCGATGPTLRDSRASLPPLSAERGRIYFYRTYNFVGSAAPEPALLIDGKIVGTAVLNGVFSCDVMPGRHAVSALGGVGGEIGGGSKYLDVDVNAGQNVYVRVSNTMSLSAELVGSESGEGDIESLHVVPSQCAGLPSDVSQSAAGAVVPGEVSDALLRGKAAEERGDPVAALTIYTATLQKYVTRLDTVSDVVDRAIDVAIRMHPPPSIPESARAHAASAVSAIRNAKTQEDFAVSRREYQSALAEAPWWSDAWFNLAKLDGQIGTSVDVRRDLTRYLRARPDAPDRAEIQKQIEVLGGKAPTTTSF